MQEEIIDLSLDYTLLHESAHFPLKLKSSLFVVPRKLSCFEWHPLIGGGTPASVHLGRRLLQIIHCHMLTLPAGYCLVRKYFVETPCKHHPKHFGD